ncbi:hypothetical protein JHK87_016379 [Glycine soja]|nr:hypothetical protein JHK87_016379 [Glycine soja]
MTELINGNKAIKENDFGEAADNFSRAHEIRVAHYGELAPECVHTYYKYGCALLYKAQEDADPLADVPKKVDGSQHGSNKDGSKLPRICHLDLSTIEICHCLWMLRCNNSSRRAH